MKDIGIVGKISSNLANKVYNDKVEPVFHEIKQIEGKEAFASILMLRAAANLFGVLGDNYEEHLDMLVDIIKKQAKEARLIERSESIN